MTTQRITIRTLLTTGEAIHSDLNVSAGKSPAKAIAEYGSDARRDDPRIAKIDWIGHSFAWVGHATPEQMSAIAADERTQLAGGLNIDGTEK